MPNPNAPDLNDLEYMTAAAEASQFNPNDHGFLAWSYDPAVAVNSSIVPIAGQLVCVRLHNRMNARITNLHLFCSTAGATLTAGQNFAGLYDANGNLLGSSADQAASWNTTGLKTMPLAGGSILPPTNDIYVCLFANGTTLPTFARAAGFSALNNANLSSGYRFQVANTGLTTALPATLASIAPGNISYWAAIS